jgi:hypothetical protein
MSTGALFELRAAKKFFRDGIFECVVAGSPAPSRRWMQKNFRCRDLATDCANRAQRCDDHFARAALHYRMEGRNQTGLKSNRHTSVIDVA